MKPLPHRYVAIARGAGAGPIELQAEGVPPLHSAAPAEFDGPGDAWSPETLLVAAIADCFILTFRAVARAGRLEWTTLECETSGTLERSEGTTAFTRFVTRVTLGVPPGADVAKARELLERSERQCLVANSLRGARSLEATVVEAAA
jgi:organic hydroperoxide reductase OsmC/OhrA